jgi:hypothetical protein
MTSRYAANAATPRLGRHASTPEVQTPDIRQTVTVKAPPPDSVLTSPGNSSSHASFNRETVLIINRTRDPYLHQNPDIYLQRRTEKTKRTRLTPTKGTPSESTMDNDSVDTAEMREQILRPITLTCQKSIETNTRRS